ncbi:nitrogen regulation protein NR(II) [Beggiatoa leptomitoformis]|uniref:histidine kinase n=1 Tax=Beggiatoa leptomitoformis TaxID=288004 RepID=A0A2N9YII1_9GAMM|nr:nitrogen regulation protein NR(II) [Beggiatoa leptomitoformis]ALG67602.1 nitrogen regulation protein NR(II) [Beggiatoa leptomitoformis]AUI70165.1 nitrogen regulation protein NR(II) [Beggiatoa leptomitoformis]
MIQAKLAQTILENLTIAVLWFNQQLRLQAMNPAAETLLEISAKQAKGQSVNELFPDMTLSGKPLVELMQHHRAVIEHGIRLRLPLARMITVDCSITPILDEHAQTHFLVEFTAIDQHLRIAREENLLLQQQAARNIVRGLAHEIKNPLGGLRGAAQLLERELPDPRLKEYTTIIIGEADRLQNLVNRMLVPNTATHKKWANIHQILIRVSQLIASETRECITIEHDFDPSIPEIWADADQLIQAVLNIMRNAVQAMNGIGDIILRTRITRQMSIGNKRHRLVIRLEIIDNGPGVPADMIDHIFYPLVTGHAQGTGLGLSIAQSLVNQHGGLIECTSKPGETVFTLWLPMEYGENGV